MVSTSRLHSFLPSPAQKGLKNDNNRSRPDRPRMMQSLQTFRLGNL